MSSLSKVLQLSRNFLERLTAEATSLLVMDKEHILSEGENLRTLFSHLNINQIIHLLEKIQPKVSPLLLFPLLCCICSSVCTGEVSAPVGRAPIQIDSEGPKLGGRQRREGRQNWSHDTTIAGAVGSRSAAPQPLLTQRPPPPHKSQVPS